MLKTEDGFEIVAGGKYRLRDHDINKGADLVIGAIVTVLRIDGRSIYCVGGDRHDKDREWWTAYTNRFESAGISSKEDMEALYG